MGNLSICAGASRCTPPPARQPCRHRRRDADEAGLMASVFRAVRPLLFRLDAERAHWLTVQSLARMPR